MISTNFTFAPLRPFGAKKLASFAFVGLSLLSCLTLQAQVLGPDFSDYSYLDLGAPPGVPGPLGGLTLKAGDPNTLLIGGDANEASGAIYQIGLVRDVDGHITGFSGVASLYSPAPNIDGGLA